jgi:hypothetical protein
VVEKPSWTAPFGFDPQMGEDIAALMGDSNVILLGRTTFAQSRAYDNGVVHLGYRS